jgi:hypothetical protein
MLAAVIGTWPQPALLESGPGFGDAGLAFLRELTHLQILNVENTNVTDAAVAALQKLRPDLKISH